MQCSCGGLTKQHISLKKKKVIAVYEQCNVERCGRVLLRPNSSLMGKTLNEETGLIE